MRWDIFGNKKLLDSFYSFKISQIELLTDMKDAIEKLQKEVNAINQENHLAHGVLSDKFDQCKILLQEINNKAKSNYSLLDEKLDREFEKINKVTEIPLIKPIIRDAERAQKKERKDKAEFDTVNNIWKN